MIAPAIIIIVMLVAGILGGSANYALSPNSDLKWHKYVIAGIVASLIVPLFLSLSQSALLRDALNSNCDLCIPNSKECSTFYYNLFVFMGFCLAAAFSSKAFLTTVADKLLSAVKDAKQEAKEAKNIAEEAKEAAIETAENIPSTRPSVPPNASDMAGQLPDISLGDNEKTILNALVHSDLAWRSISGISREVGLGAIIIETTLEQLLSKKLVEKRVSRHTKSVFYKITPTGLAIIYSGH